MSLGLAIMLVAMTSVSLGALLIPLLVRQRGAASREAYNLTVYRDQLAEVERDVGRGVLAGGEAEAARTEIGRRILALKPAEGDGGRFAAPVVGAVVGILILPVAALLLYGQLGSPALPDQPFAERAASGDQTAHLDMHQALQQIEAHLKTHPDDLTGWLLAARTQISLHDYQAASQSYRRAVDLSGHRADIVGDWGEAQVMAAGGTVTPAAKQAFEAALRDPETAPRARYYLALAQMQEGDVKGALKAWTALAADAPADAAWLPVVKQRIAEASAKLGTAPPASKPAAEPAAMPSAEAVSKTAKALAGASPDQRRAMIDAMVARLAARLEKQPDDADGWTRLGRSYMVLQQPEKAQAAYARAVKLRPDDAALKQALAEAAAAANPGK